MSGQRLLKRITQFEQCNDCLDNTLKDPTRLILSQDQVLCSVCSNNSIHAVPLHEVTGDLEEEAYVVFEKKPCKKHITKRCKSCSIYLNKKSYWQCPTCHTSIFRKNLERWTKLYTFHKCQVCFHEHCMTCDQSRQIFSDNDTCCLNCHRDKESGKQFLKKLPSIEGIRFIMAMILLLFFIPIMMLAKVYRKLQKTIWENTTKEPLENLEILKRLAFSIICGPIIYIFWYCGMFVPYYIKTYYKCFKQLKYEIFKM